MTILRKQLHKKITSLRELAKELGVSIPAASRALRNHPRISVDLRERAKALARQHGYTPNLTQSRAGSRRWRSVVEGGVTIGMLVDNAQRIEASKRESFKKFAASLGYRVEEVILSNFASPAEAGRKLIYRGIEALLVLAVFDEATIREFPWGDFCAVALIPGYCRAPVPLVIPDMEASLTTAFREAYAKGYRRPGLALYGEIAIPLDDFEKKMTLEYHLRQPPYADCARLPIFETFEADNFQPFARWMEEHRPDVVIGQSGQFYWNLIDAGYRVPEDVGFISMGEVLGTANEHFTGMIQDNSLLVRAAIQLLDAKLRHFDHAPLQMAATLRLEMPWNEGTTLPVRKKTET